MTSRPAISAIHAACKTVLVLEDDDTLRDLVRISLEALGYGVLVAVDGVHALGVAAEYQGRIDLLLSDIESSSTDSRELWSATREQRPDTKILFMFTSAWRNDVDTSAIPEDVYQLQRPFDVERLEDAIHGALNGPSKPNPPGEPSALDGVF